jgi:uncharacterized protein
MLLAVAAAQAYLFLSFMRQPAFRARRWALALVGAGFAACTLAVIIGAGTHYSRFAPYVPAGLGRIVGGAGLMWGVVVTGTAVIVAFWKAVPPFNPQRRRALGAIRTASIAAPAAVMGFGVIVERTRFELTEIDLHLPNLPPDLNGLRLVHFSDIHLGSFLSERELARAIDMANETRPDVGFVTGDLITFRGDPAAAALRQLARLKAPSGVWGCHGNHEVYAGIEEALTAHGARLGVRFLRGESHDLRFGSSILRVAGVDYQRFNHPYLEGARPLPSSDPAALSLLLSHNPDVLPKAAELGFRLVLAGHTHGGQVNVEILGRDLNVARFYTPYVRGLYRHGSAHEYVSRGIGTIGMPARFGARPEVVAIKLCAS